MTTLKHQTVTGIKWLVGSSFLQKAIQLAGTVVLARILGPADFGLFALAFVAIDALGLFRSMGFDSALIQRKDEVEKAANTAFFIIPVLGIVLYLILSLSAPWIGKFLNNTQVVGVIRALGIIFIISCFGKVPAALLEKNMQFRKVATIEIGTAIIYAVSAVTFALMKFGVWSLVYAYILKTIYQNTLTFIYARWRPRFEFDKKIALEMFHFGKFIFFGSVVWFLKMNLDNALVGKLLGVTALGLYAIAFNIANFTADYFSSKVYRVAFPAYSKSQNDSIHLKPSALKTLKHIGIIALPFGIFMFLLSRESLCFIYGNKWAQAAKTLQILSLGGIFNALPVGIAATFLALGKPRLGFWIVVVQVTIYFIFIVPAAKLFGINGVAIVVTFSSFTFFFLIIKFGMKLLSIRLEEVFDNLKQALLSSLLMGLGIILLKNLITFLPIKQSVSLMHYSFLFFIFTSGVVYFFILFKLDKLILKEIKGILF